MDDRSNHRTGGLEAPPRSIQVILIIAAISAAVVLLFRMIFHRF
jgi:hypothetical protein